MEHLLRSVEPIRHSAVHRVPQTPDNLGRLIDVACRLSRALQSSQKAVQLQKLHQAVSEAASRADTRKAVARNSLEKLRQEIRAKKRKLNMKADSALRAISAKHSQDAALHASQLQAAIKSMFKMACDAKLVKYEPNRIKFELSALSPNAGNAHFQSTFLLAVCSMISILICTGLWYWSGSLLWASPVKLRLAGGNHSF